MRKSIHGSPFPPYIGMGLRPRGPSSRGSSAMIGYSSGNLVPRVLSLKALLHVHGGRFIPDRNSFRNLVRAEYPRCLFFFLFFFFLGGGVIFGLGKLPEKCENMSSKWTFNPGLKARLDGLKFIIIEIKFQSPTRVEISAWAQIHYVTRFLLLISKQIVRQFRIPSLERLRGSL